MNKYAVQIDPKKVEKEKLANKKPQNQPDDYEKGESNVPLDPIRGSEPFEKEKAPDAKDK